MTFDNVKQVCDCGHDKATHHFDERGPGDCLGMHCDCLGYHEPGTRPIRARYPQIIVNDPLEEAVDTPRMWPPFWPMPAPKTSP